MCTESSLESGRGIQERAKKRIKSSSSISGSQKRISKTEKSRTGNKICYLEIWRISQKYQLIELKNHWLWGAGNKV